MTRLDAAEQHFLAPTARLADEQRALISELRAMGVDIKLARQVLARLEEALRLMRTDIARERAHRMRKSERIARAWAHKRGERASENPGSASDSSRI